MSLQVEKREDVAVITVKGNLMGGRESDAVYEKVKQLLSAGTKHFVVDLSRVKWMNSQGLGSLMACLTSSRNMEGDLKITGATEKVKSILMVTKLMTIFEHFDSVDAAVQSY